MAGLSNDKFWKDAEKLVGKLQTDGPLSFMLLDNGYRMQPLIRNKEITFTDFLVTDPTLRNARSSSTAISTA